jgi:hypothetical protein
MYSSLQKDGHDAILLTLSAGTTHKPNPLDENGFIIYEAAAAAQELIALGISPSAILEENASLDTIGNAYFARMVHVLPGGFKKVVVITNLWHMPRVEEIFRTVFSLPLSKEQQHTRGRRVELAFESVRDALPSEQLEVRMAREKESLRVFVEATKGTWRDMKDLHSFLFQKHLAYASSRHTRQKVDTLNKELLGTY